MSSITVIVYLLKRLWVCKEKTVLSERNGFYILEGGWGEARRGNVGQGLKTCNFCYIFLLFMFSATHMGLGPKSLPLLH